VTESKPKTRSIDLTVETSAGLDTVWRALTDPKEMERWFPMKATGTSGPGGSITLSFGPQAEWTTHVTVWDPPNHVQFADPVDPSRPDAGLRVDFHVETRAGRTVVRLVHSGFDASADWDEQFTSTTNGWRYFLMNLRHYLERHANTPRTMVCERRQMTKPPSEVWAALFEEPVLDGVVDAKLEEVSRDRHAWGRIPSLNDGLLFVEFEGGPTVTGGHVGVWISTYGVPAAKTSALQAALTTALDRRLGAAVTAESAPGRA
jgi:uncharacterized protein YndB with AHSA1/START domain